MRRMAEAVEVHPANEHSMAAELEMPGAPEMPSGVVVYEIAGPMFFGAVEKFERALLETNTLPETSILRLVRVPFMDITGIETLAQNMAELRRKKVQVLLCEANQRVLAKLRNAHVLPRPGDDGYWETLHEALVYAKVGQSDAAAPA